MSVETSLYTLLTDATGVTDLVDDRVWPLRVPDGTALPAIRYQVIVETHGRTMLGSSGYVRATVQIDAVALSYAEAADLAEQVRLNLDGVSGEVNGDKIQAISRIDGSDRYDDHRDAEGDRGVYVKSADYDIQARIAIPTVYNLVTDNAETIVTDQGDTLQV